MGIDRRVFLKSSGLAAFGALVPRICGLASASDTSEPFEWKTTNLILPFEVTAGKLRQKRIVPAGTVAAGADNSSGVEVALQCSGENSPDQGMKSGVGQPGARLLFAGRREESTREGKRLVCIHTDPVLKLAVESVYEAFDGIPVVRRYSRVTNNGDSCNGYHFQRVEASAPDAGAVRLGRRGSAVSLRQTSLSAGARPQRHRRSLCARNRGQTQDLGVSALGTRCLRRTE
jgi:alpha-galactosidase